MTFNNKAVEHIQFRALLRPIASTGSFVGDIVTGPKTVTDTSTTPS